MQSKQTNDDVSSAKISTRFNVVVNGTEERLSCDDMMVHLVQKDFFSFYRLLFLSLGVEKEERNTIESKRISTK